MDLTIEPYAGVLPIRFGMPRAEVRRLLAPEVPVTKKLFVSPLPRDTFLQTGLHVYYRDPGCCEAVELFAPAAPTLHGQPILGRPYTQVERWLLQLDPSSRLDPTGLRASQLGVAVFIPSRVKSPNDSVQGVIAFDRGYYERHGIA